MAEFSAVVDHVSSVIARCIECAGNEDIADLDFILTFLVSSSTELGELLDEVLVTRERHVDENVLTRLRDLRICLSQLYETKLFFLYPEWRAGTTPHLYRIYGVHPQKGNYLVLIMLQLQHKKCEVGNVT